MIRFIIALLTIALSAPSLLAAARIAPAATTPTEPVNWTAGVSYTYDGSGNIKQIGNDRFAYDKVGRLAEAETNGLTRTYQYDAFGNRIACTHTPGTATEGDCQMGMRIATESNRVEGVEYDGAGNVSTFSGHRYSYDATNMPTRDQSGALAKEFIYTAADERIATVTLAGNASWNWTIRDLGGKVLREFRSGHGPQGPGTGAWTLIRDHVFRDGLLLASRHRAFGEPVTYHYHLDHLGTPRRVTDQNNRLVGFHDYHAFGSEMSGGLTESAPTSLQYTGHERDKWGGSEGPDTLDYMHARYYSPVLGRFLSIDAGTFTPPQPQSWNRYAYVRNNPIKAVDPNGDETFLVVYGAGELRPDMRGGHGDVGDLFKVAAQTRKAEIMRSAAFKHGTDQVFLIHATNADEFYNAVNHNYPSGNIEGLEVFSHAWSGGLNLGGSGDRGIRSDNIGRIDASNFANGSSITLWGCNTGCPVPQGVPFAQQLANALGIPVGAHQGPTEFKQGGKGHPPMVPSNPKRGSFRIFNPQNSALLPLPKPPPAGACIEGQPGCR